LGSTRTRTVDIRLIAATNKDIAAAVKDGVCREDLYYRLSVVTLCLPPLRERRKDIPLLANHFLSTYAREIAKPVKGFHETALKILYDYSWPGNVRELQNVVERAILISDRDLVYPEHLSENMKTTSPFLFEALDKSLSIENYTRQFIERFQLELGEQQLAAKLGITRKALWEKRKRWGLVRSKQVCS